MQRYNSIQLTVLKCHASSDFLYLLLICLFIDLFIPCLFICLFAYLLNHLSILIPMQARGYGAMITFYMQVLRHAMMYRTLFRSLN